MMPGTLFIVATPLGNLGDMTARAIETLKTVDIIYAEDTRSTKKLLGLFSIDTEVKSYHQHSGEARAHEIAALLEEGKSIAYVSDAGTPSISDPGGELVENVSSVKGQVPNIVAVPGASAVTAALSISGFPADKFLFLGFPPHKKKRNQFFEEVAAAKYTVVFYESPYRIAKAIVQMKETLLPTRHVCICRELTKKFETTYRGTITDIAAMEIPPKGEFVVIVRSEKI